jgi:replication factor A1
MFKIPIDELKVKIVESGKITKEELDNKIKAKINELSGLISEEGAAHIISNELGVEFKKEAGENLKIKDVYVGMKGISVTGKVTRKFDVRTFNRNDKEGKVCSLVFGDESGTMRVVFWNDQVDLVNEVKEDDILSLNGCFVKESYNGGKEAHLGDGELVINPEGVEIGEVKKTFDYKRKKIEELAAGERGIEILGTVVQIFDPRFFYLCSKCNKKVTQSEEKFICAEHEVVEPTLSYCVNLVVDDGSGNIRSVFWKNQVNNLLGIEEEQVAKFKDEPNLFENVKNDLLGEQYKLMGRVVKNDFFDRLEFSVQVVNKADPADELEKKA